MHVFDREQHRLRLTDAYQRFRDRMEEPSTLLLRVEHIERREVGKDRNQLGKGAYQFRRCRCENVRRCAGRIGGGIDAHEVEERRVRHRAIGLERRTLQHDKTALPGLRHELAQHA